MGTAYAVWGAIGTVIVGMCWFTEPVTTIRIGLILGVILCVVGLKVTGG